MISFERWMRTAIEARKIELSNALEKAPDVGVIKHIRGQLHTLNFFEKELSVFERHIGGDKNK